MSCKKYRPSNGSEGMWFDDKFCCNCLNMHPDPDKQPQCEIVLMAMCYYTNEPEYPKEWVYDENDNPTCTAFKKWDWGKDDDGNWNDPPPIQPDDPNQLCLPFIFDEIGVPKYTLQTV